VADTGVAPRVLLDRYELREQVGLGGMGEVWLGWDRRLRRDVAVKLLLPQLSEEPSFRRRFEVEARVAAAIDHPNIVRVYDIDDDRGSLFIVMERLPGPSLDRRLAEGAMGPDEVVRVGVDLLSGLAAAHEQDLVHRDIKPGNLIRSAGGRWKVGDFGVAKNLASPAQLTLVGVAVGTPAYLAPEQLDGRPATPATDLWAAAVVLREALTGRRPYEGDDPIAVAHAVATTPLAPMASVRPDISAAVAGTLDRALQIEPTNRFARAADMLAALEGRAPAAAPAGAAPAAIAPPATTAPPGMVAPGPGPTSTAGAPPLAAVVDQGAPVAAIAAPTGDDAGRSRLVKAAGLAIILLGVIALLFMLGLVIGLFMNSDDDGGNDRSPGETSLPSEETPTSTASENEADPGPGPDPSAPPRSSSTSTSPPATTAQEPGSDGGFGQPPATDSPTANG